MRYLRVAFLALMCGCCLAPDPPGPEDDGRIYISVSNNSDKPVNASLGAGLFSQALSLKAHETRELWFYRDYLPKRVRLVIIPAKE